MNKGENRKRYLSLQFNRIFPRARNAKKLRWFNFLYFHNCWNLNFGPTGACYQEWNNLVARGMVAESKRRLATNRPNIFADVVVSLLTVKYRFPRLRFRHFISATKIRYWSISVFYSAPKMMPIRKSGSQSVCLCQGFSNYGRRPQMWSWNVISGRETNWLDKSDITIIVNFTRKSKVGRQWIYFYCIFSGYIVICAVSCLGSLPELPNDNGQPSTSYVLSRHDCLNVDWPILILFHSFQH